MYPPPCPSLPFKERRSTPALHDLRPGHQRPRLPAGRQPLPPLAREQLQILPLYTNILTEVGLGEESYLAIQQRQAATVGSISAFVGMRGNAHDEQAVDANLTLSSKALLRNARDQAQLMSDTLHRVHFSETDRIRDLVNQQRARRDQSITGSGHSLAMTAACAGMSPLARLHHQHSGLAGIRQLRLLDDSLANEQACRRWRHSWQELHGNLVSTPMQFLVVAEDHQWTQSQSASDIWSQAAGGAASRPSPARRYASVAARCGSPIPRSTFVPGPTPLSRSSMRMPPR